MALLADFGTSWTKTLDTSSGIKSVRKTTEVASLKADLATGHNTRKRTVRTVNELIALGDGAMQMTGDENYTVLDIGSRDVKYVRFEKNRVAEMNWSAKCGALTGFTLELIMSYFSLNPEEVKPEGKATWVTCSVLGMEQLFEAVASGRSINSAVAEFTRGLAMNAWFFIEKPERFYLSGGMCDNPLFMKSFPENVEVIPLGRFVLIEGLKKELGK